MARRSDSSLPSTSGLRSLGSSTPERSARMRTASGKARRSWRMRKLKASPPTPQPKQWKIPRLGLTVKEGVFSVWKGQRPFQCSPAFFRFTKRPTSSTMSTRERLFHGAAEGARALAVDDAHLGEAGQERVVQVFLEQVTGLVGGAPDEVDL